ncbi:MAG: excisionase [Gallionella sp.]
MVRFKTIAQFCAESGYTDAAVRGKIREGVWLERRVWRKAPDGHVLIDIEGYNEWVTNGSGLACAPHQKAPSKLTSSTSQLGVGNDSKSSPAPLT